ncbi:Os03g0419300 [Oryza sativa Japonica Group]|uniref:Os03g0419300 protein n=3 Tax=Oryza TaxID=4527 RepID=Q75GD1_ORYSJ|nr:hypothetical protein [Oryza sativa Japonica Group]ABF96651.1 hypothetical protein LOC_Os03g30590 [Oryza sativa Japonica Group]BAS84728.1 Os03g0419300 [Oryza sativa Japonica Group]
MAVPVVEQPVQAAATDWMGRLQVTAEGLRDIGALVAAAATRIQAARAALGEAAGLIGEDASAAETLDADVWSALAHAGQAPIPDATVDAAAKLLATVSSGAPLLPGAIRAAGDLISTVFEIEIDIDDQAAAAAPTGLLSEAIRDLSVAFGLGSVHNNVEFHFLTCAPYLHVRAGDLTDLTWFAWSKQTERAKKLATEAELWINAAAWEAKDAAERARSHSLVQSPERNEHMGELQVSLLMATRYADKALAAVDMVRDAVESMDQTLHQAIGNAHIPDPYHPMPIWL